MRGQVPYSSHMSHGVPITTYYHDVHDLQDSPLGGEGCSYGSLMQHHNAPSPSSPVAWAHSPRCRLVQSEGT